MSLNGGKKHYCRQMLTCFRAYVPKKGVKRLETRKFPYKFAYRFKKHSIAECMNRYHVTIKFNINLNLYDGFLP